MLAASLLQKEQAFVWGPGLLRGLHEAGQQLNPVHTLTSQLSGRHSAAFVDLMGHSRARSEKLPASVEACRHAVLVTMNSKQLNHGLNGLAHVLLTKTSSEISSPSLPSAMLLANRTVWHTADFIVQAVVHSPCALFPA